MEINLRGPCWLANRTPTPNAWLLLTSPIEAAKATELLSPLFEGRMATGHSSVWWKLCWESFDLSHNAKMSLATAPSLPPYSSLEHGCDDQSDCLATSSDFERPQVKWKVKGAWILGDPGSRRSSSRRPPAHLSSNEKNKLRLLELVSCLWQMKAFLTHSPAVVRATEHIWHCVLENGNN